MQVPSNIEQLEGMINSSCLTFRTILLDSVQEIFQTKEPSIVMLKEKIEQENLLADKQQLTLIILHLYLEVVDFIRSYVNNLEIMNKQLKRFKLSFSDEQLWNSVQCYSPSNFQTLTNTAYQLQIPLPGFLLKKKKKKEDMTLCRQELFVCQETCNYLFSKLKSIYKKSCNEVELIEELIDAVEGKILFTMEQEQFERLIEKTLIYELICEYELEEDFIVDSINDCCDKYEKEQEALKQRHKKFVSIWEENQAKRLQTVQIEAPIPPISSDLEEGLEETSVHTYQESQVWLDMLREGVEMNLVFNTLKLKNDEMLTQRFYESLQEELSAYEEDLLPLATTSLEQEKIKKEIFRYQTYLSGFENYFMAEEEFSPAVEQNRLIFATTPTGNFCLNTSLSNIPSEFHKKELGKAFYILKYGGKETINSHLKYFGHNKKRKGLYQYRVYDTRILLRILDDHTYYIIDAFVKKCHRTNGYSQMVTQSYEHTALEYETLKLNRNNSEILNPYLKKAELAYQEIQKNARNEKKRECSKENNQKLLFSNRNI